MTPISHTQTCAPPLLPDSNLTTRPPTVQRKRRWDAANLYDEDAQTATPGRQVRPRLDPMDNGRVGSQSNSARPNPPRPHPTATSIEQEANPTLRGPNPSEQSPTFPITRIPPAAPLPLSPSEPDSEPTVEPSDNHESRSQQCASPDTRGGNAAVADAADTTLQATNPGHGPIAGGIPIWLSVLNPPTNFPLFARFGTNVTATVSPYACAYSPILNTLVVFRKSQHIDVHTPFCGRSWACTCYTIASL